MDEKKICFIMCTNNEEYEKECIKYLCNLRVPEGYTVQEISIKDAKSMTSGYQEAMEYSDAKYKIYLHQDVFITNKNFIEDLIRIFEDENVGMLGVVGSVKMPDNYVMWAGARVGGLYTSNILKSESVVFKTNSAEELDFEVEVEAIDGMIMATQYDLNWRTDLFDGWDFYDVSQCYEFRKKGYKIVVPIVKKPWCIHDSGLNNLEKYYKYRDIFVKEYV